MKVVTCIAPVNIAVIKYWGKRDEDLILPINDSISATLSVDNMCAKTTIMASPSFKEHMFWLNGKEESFENARLQNCLKEIKKRISGTENVELADCCIHICSENNFPTAAGLASSAAGYACLVSALAALYGIGGDISAIARQGSGSACRSVYGGWVQWSAGTCTDGSDSVASVVAPADHWPEMRVIVLVVNDQRKKYSSTTGMRTSVLTSALLEHRASDIVPERVVRMRNAILTRNFHDFAMLTMKDSNQFHAVCLDTYPPCVYMNDVSHAIAATVHAYNDYCGVNKVAYTFDAGPNACLYLLEENLGEVLALIQHTFPTALDGIGDGVHEVSLSEELKKIVEPMRHDVGAVKYTIQTTVGSGPRILIDDSDHLLDNSGYPKK